MKTEDSALGKGGKYWLRGDPQEAMVGGCVNRKHRVDPRALCSHFSESFLGKQEGLGVEAAESGSHRCDAVLPLL